MIDSNDLPLNVSREILQQSRDVEAIRTTSVKRVLGLLEDLASKEADKFTTFWKSSVACSRKESSTTPPIAIASQSCFASHRRTPRPPSRRSRCPTTSAG